MPVHFFFSWCSVTQSCLTLCNPMDCSLTGSSVHGISQARRPGWVDISFSRGSSWPKGQTCISCVSCISRWTFYHCATWEAPFSVTIKQNAAAAAAKSLQSCLTLCDPIDSSPLGSSVSGILQARTLERVAISFSNAKVKLFSSARLLATPWTAAYQAPPSMGCSRQEYWNGVPLPSSIKQNRESNFYP